MGELMLLFTSEEERASHREGKLVNSFLMNKYFNHVLTENQLDLLRGHLGLVDFVDLISNASITGQLKLLICYISGQQGRLETFPEVLIAHLPPALIVTAFALTGQFDLIKQIKVSPELLKEILERKDSYNSLISMETGSPFIDYLNFDISESLKVKDSLISANYHHFIALAGKNGHLDILKYFEGILSKAEIKEGIVRIRFDAYRLAAQNGHLDILKYFEGILSKAEIKEGVAAIRFYAYRLAVQNGHLDILTYFEGLLGKAEIKETIAADDFYAYRLAAQNGHLDILSYFESILTEAQIKEAIAADDFYAYRYAAQNGHLDILSYLESILTEAQIKKAIAAHNFHAYVFAALNGHLDVVKHLFKDAGCLSYAEKHDRENGEKYIYSYVSCCIYTLREEKARFEGTSPNGVFDMSAEKARHAFYLLRNLIRRGVDREYGNLTRTAEDLSEDIRFLLSIPAVKALCHQTVTVDAQSPGCENELLKLANRIGNEEAAGILLQLPEVRRLAEAANFYPEETAGALDLRQVTQDRESSMVALSASERKFVAKATSYYQETIHEKGGNEAVFSELKEELEERYKESPAILTLPLDSGEIGSTQGIELPTEWSELQILRRQLTPAQYESALKAYYAHDAHTAYRYLSKPNHWMAPNASYIYVYFDEAGNQTDLRYSTYEEYKTLISLFYTAAFDDTMPAIDGYTLDTRKELFIKQLALIGRAHNWDNSPDKSNEAAEEYDDGDADRPSCFSGVNRRLFQSVLGHGLFKVVNRHLVIQALNEQIREYFEKVITAQNAPELKTGLQQSKYHDCWQGLSKQFKR
jgi:hypothetical protein